MSGGHEVNVGEVVALFPGGLRLGTRLGRWDPLQNKSPYVHLVSTYAYRPFPGGVATGVNRR